MGLNAKYIVSSEIGNGRFGVVKKCYSKDSNECFALKSINKTLISNDKIDMQCIQNEPKIMHLVSHHHNIVQIYDVFEDDTYMHIVMEICDGGDLYQMIVNGVFSEEKAAGVMVPLMDAIAHCHSRGVAHRDIKPDNILFDSWGRLKLADFGSAELFRDGDLMTGVVGTPYYVAPEVLQGRDYNEKCDVWSAGVILYVMLAGVPPFYGETAGEIFEAVLRGNLRFPTRIFGSVSSAAKDLLRRMICRDVSKRLSAQQVLNHPWIIEGRATLAART